MKPFHLNKTSDLSLGQLEEVLGESLAVSKRVEADLPEPTLPMLHQTGVWLTTKDSMRTKASINQALTRLGGTMLEVGGGSLVSTETKGTREPLADIMRCLDAMGYRVMFARLHTQAQTNELIGASRKMSVINALNDTDHPLQSLADAAALIEKDGWGKGKKVVFAGPGDNNVTISLAEVAAQLGWDFVHTGPQDHQIPGDRFLQLQEIARKGGGSVRYVEDWSEAVPGATMLYTDVHASMGQKDQAAQLKAMLEPWRVTEQMMERAGPQAYFGHCLPAERGVDTDNAVIEGPRSIVFPIAGFRAHTTTALLRLLKEGKLKA